MDEGTVIALRIAQIDGGRLAIGHLEEWPSPPRCGSLQPNDMSRQGAGMAQLGFFDADRRLAALSAKGDPLETIGTLVPWESFRADIEAVVLTPEEARKSNAGRKPIDAIGMFRMLVLQSLYNLSDEQVEIRVRDRLS